MPMGKKKKKKQNSRPSVTETPPILHERGEKRDGKKQPEVKAALQASTANKRGIYKNPGKSFFIRRAKMSDGFMEGAAEIFSMFE